MTYLEAYNWLKNFYRALPVVGMFIMLIIMLVKKRLGGEVVKVKNR